jgi:exosortase A-associated hydrolase 2
VTVAPQAFFLTPDDGRPGRRLALFYPAQGPVTRGLVNFVHPFAEEMNKSRRMVALQSRALAAAGFAVLQLDLHGCGDSSGDFGDANWTDWVADVEFGARWLRAQSDAPLWIWGLRAGCLLAAEAARRAPEPLSLLFWQPTLLGRSVLQQFLRLKLAADLIEGQDKGAMEGLRMLLAQGRAVDIAGYRLSAALASGLEAASLQPQPTPARLEWLELSGQTNPTLQPASGPPLERWRQSGAAVRSRAVTGPAFWQTAEIEEAPALLAATLAALEEEVVA